MGIAPQGTRSLRGGSWNNNARNLRAANRNRNTPSNRNNNNGFRVALGQHIRVSRVFIFTELESVFRVSMSAVPVLLLPYRKVAEYKSVIVGLVGNDLFGFVRFHLFEHPAMASFQL